MKGDEGASPQCSERSLSEEEQYACVLQPGLLQHQRQPTVGYLSLQLSRMSRRVAEGELAVSKRKALGVDEQRNGLRHCLAKEESHEGEVVHSKKLENREEGGTS